MTAIAIFVKTPGVSPVKSRLAADIGAHLASECHRRCARTVAAVACQAEIGTVYWAVAEGDPLAQKYWSDLPLLIQNGSGLGERMQGIHAALIAEHGSGLLLGADLPQLEPEALQHAAQHLARSQASGVVGPAIDGGFWLIGANSSLPTEMWSAPEYGASRVMRDFLSADGALRCWLQLDQRSDLDRLSDLPRVIEELAALTSPHPLQRQLLDWLRYLANEFPIHTKAPGS